LSRRAKATDRKIQKARPEGPKQGQQGARSASPVGGPEKQGQRKPESKGQQRSEA
jgi:hypothetical protein